MKTMLTALLICCMPLATVAITIDGMNITGDFANAPWVTFQDTETAWGANNSILACYLDTNATALLVGIPSVSDNNAVGFIIDGDPGTGSNVMPSGLTMPDAISVGMAGMTFDTAFTPDRLFCVRVAGGRSAAWPALENIVANSRTYLGGLGNIGLASSVTTNGNLVLGAFMPVGLALEQTNTAADGVEIAIPYDLLGNVSPTVNVMVVFTGNDGTWANNQTLAPTGGNTNYWISSPSAQHNAALVPGNQFMTIIIPSIDTNLQVAGAVSKYLLFAGTGPLTFNANVSGGTPPYSYQWLLGNGVVTNLATFAYAYPNAGMYDVKLIGRDAGGQVVTSTVGTVKVYAQTFVDGLNITNDFAGKGTNVVQDTLSNWGTATLPGTGAELLRLCAFSDGNKLYAGICGNLLSNVPDNVVALLVDVDYAAGSNVLPAVTAGGGFQKMLNLQGMTFDTDFSPDKALLMSVNGTADFWPNYYHIDQISNEWYWGGTKTEWTSMFNGLFIQCVNDRNNTAGDIMAVNNDNVADAPDANSGIECMLDYDSLVDGGLIMGPNVKVQAILYHWTWVETNVANQSLPGINGDANGYGTAASVNYSLVPGNQYIEIGAPIPEPALFCGLLLGALLLRRR